MSRVCRLPSMAFLYKMLWTKKHICDKINIDIIYFGEVTYMSRSYRKFAVVKDRCRTSKRFMKPKTDANRAVRRADDVPQHSGYKKLYCSWFISDYRFMGSQSATELKRKWDKGDSLLHYHYDTFREAYIDWLRYYKRK